MMVRIIRIWFNRNGIIGRGMELENKFWVLEAGTIGFMSKHPSLELALDYAKDLAVSNPSAEYYIMQIVKHVKAKVIAEVQ